MYKKDDRTRLTPSQDHVPLPDELGKPMLGRLRALQRRSFPKDKLALNRRWVFVNLLLALVLITSIALAITPAEAASNVLVGAGDISSCGNNNDEATAKLLDKISGTVFTTGDNVYSSGSASQYADCYGPTWGRHKSRTKPTPGNHEYKTSSASAYFDYFNGIAPYYAYTRGNWRIYALNSEIDVSATSPQVKWLKADLAANPKLCVMAYWHKPRWSSGAEHGSDSKMQTIWQVLANAGAELVVNGHEHNYERFRPMNRYGKAAPKGMREIVVGTGGASHYGFGTILATSQVRNSDTYGVLRLVLKSTSYSWKFIHVAGKTFTDSGTTYCH